MAQTDFKVKKINYLIGIIFAALVQESIGPAVAGIYGIEGNCIDITENKDTFDLDDILQNITDVNSRDLLSIKKSHDTVNFKLRNDNVYTPLVNKVYVAKDYILTLPGNYTVYKIYFETVKDEVSFVRIGSRSESEWTRMPPLKEMLGETRGVSMMLSCVIGSRY